jgi:subtilase family serine protease
VAKQKFRRAESWIELMEGRLLLSAAPLHRPVAYPTYHLATQQGAKPAGTTGPVGLTPQQISQAYGINAVRFNGITGNGAGQTIAIIDAFDNPNAASDLASFDARFGLPAPPSFQKLNEYGGTTQPATDTAAKPNTWELEESLDVQWAHAVAPAASIILYEANSASFTDLISNALNSARNNASVSVITMSFSTSEFSGENSFDSYFATPAGHQGITFIAATGDTGSPGGYPSYSPNVLAVGATTLNVDSSGNYINESAWSGSGGGTSTQESKPSYQQSVQNTASRTTPDVSIVGDPNTGVAVYDTFDNGAASPWITIGGTSVSAPMWGGLIAIADQGRALNGLGSLDGKSQTLPMLYQAPSADFHDILSGSNGAFSAGPGYDRVTGLGTPVANLLIPSLVGTSATSSSIFSSTSAPASGLENVNDPAISSAGGVELGMKFRSDTSGYITGVRFWKGSFDGGTHSGELWSSTGTELATATFTGESAGGWQQVSFSTPVAVSANTTYIVSYHTSAAYIAYTPNAFATSGVDNAPLHALGNGVAGGNGVYHYDAVPGVGSFPTVYNSQAPYYWVDVTFSSTSIPSTPPVATSLESSSTSPAAYLQNVNDSSISAAGGVELGLKFRSDAAGYVTAVRFWKGINNTGVHTGELWSSDGTLLATATFTNESASGWQQVNFSTPVLIAANTTYIVSYHTTAPYIAYGPNVFATSGIDSGPLHALSNSAGGGNGVYHYDATPGVSSFPNVFNGQSPYYWVDVVYTPS